MTFSERCKRVTYLGMQMMIDGPGIPLFWDPETGTTFAVHEHETLADALRRVDDRYSIPA